MPNLLYENISNDIIRQIKTKELKEEDRLSERSLAEKYSVSRTVIRDALKVLNEKGYVMIRPGKGHYVKFPNEDDFRGKVGSIIENSTIPMESILEARELIEISMVPLIIERATETDIEDLQKLYIQMQDVMDERILYSELDKKFHIRLMSCCQNEMLMFFVKTLNDTTDRSGFMWDKPIRENAQREHQEMIQALKAKNEERLRYSFGQHIVCIKEHIQTV